MESSVTGSIIAWSARNKLMVLILTVCGILYALHVLSRMPLDAVPDLSDTQVIIYSQWEQSPDIVDDQVTYPIVTALLGAPKVRTVRGISDFGFSYVYVIFEDGTDLYWARSRVLEYLSKAQASLPAGVKTEIGPDATSVGWVYQYVLTDESGRLDSTELRRVQDWQLRFHLQSVPGVAEVAAIGGPAREYQVDVDPLKLRAYGITLEEIVSAVRSANGEASGRLLEVNGREYMIRLRGYAKRVTDLEEIVVRPAPGRGTALVLKHVAHVVVGSQPRRGVSDFNGAGETPGGIVLMRQGSNVLNVIGAVKSKLAEIHKSLPPGVKVTATYDRSVLVERSISTLYEKLALEMVIVSIVILLFLWHVPSAIVPIVTIPVSVLLAFIPMYWLGLTSNIMSLAGIAISVGVLVDGAIVEVENAYRRIHVWQAGGEKGDLATVRLEALQEVAPSVFFSLLVIAVSFLPIFALVDYEGRLFKPLAISKTLAMLIAALLALTLDPALRLMFTRVKPFSVKPRFLARSLDALCVGRYYSEERHPISRLLSSIYEPILRKVLAYPVITISSALVVVLGTLPLYFRIGSEFMPPLEEGSLLYMPTAFPGMSLTEAKRVLTLQDRLIRSFPEVLSVHGKAGRAETATDPAPFSMIETVIVLKPESEWPAVERWYSGFPSRMQPLFFWTALPHRTHSELVAALDASLKLPGMPNIWTMPIRNRIDMLSTGIRSPLGIKIMGDDTAVLQRIGEKAEVLLKSVRGTRSAVAERSAGGYYLDYVLKRDDLKRYGLSIAYVEDFLAAALGGEIASTIFGGRERFPVRVRYERGSRDSLETLRQILLPTPAGAQIPITEVADFKMVDGPAMIRNENGHRASFVYIDVTDRDLGGYVREAQALLARELVLPAGYVLIWSGQYEHMQRAHARLLLVLPLALGLIVLLLYLNTNSAAKTALVLLAVPFSLVGALMMLWLLGYHFSVAVWVGLIALAGLDAETGVFMLLYLDLALRDRVSSGTLRNDADLREALIEGAAKRLRPKLMTVAAATIGLLPIMFSTAPGSDVMKRIAAPMIGGLVTSFALELLVYPAVYYVWKRRAPSGPHRISPSSSSMSPF